MPSSDRVSNADPIFADPEDSLIRGLVARASRADSDAWRDLVSRYAPRVFAMARSRLGNADAADEIVQSVMATVAAKLGSGTAAGYEERGRFESWLFRIAMNRVRDEARKRRRRRLATGGATSQESEEPQTGFDDAVVSGLSIETDPAIDRLRRALPRLGDADREIIALRHHAGMAFRDIAELLGQPIGTVLARHHRALKKLKNIMEESGGSDDDNPDRAYG